MPQYTKTIQSRNKLELLWIMQHRGGNGIEIQTTLQPIMGPEARVLISEENPSRQTTALLKLSRQEAKTLVALLPGHPRVTTTNTKQCADAPTAVSVRWRWKRLEISFDNARHNRHQKVNDGCKVRHLSIRAGKVIPKSNKKTQTQTV